MGHVILWSPHVCHAMMRSPGWVRATRVLGSRKAAQGVASHAFQSLLFVTATLLLLIPYAVDPLFKTVFYVAQPGSKCCILQPQPSGCRSQTAPPCPGVPWLLFDGISGTLHSLSKGMQLGNSSMPAVLHGTNTRSCPWKNELVSRDWHLLTTEAGTLQEEV